MLDCNDDDDDEAVGLNYHSSECGVNFPNWSKYSSRHHTYTIYLVFLYDRSLSHNGDLDDDFDDKIETLEITVRASALRQAV